MTKFVYLFFLLFLCNISISQNIIKGQVNDPDGVAVSSANAKIQIEGNNKILAYTTTDINGNFELNYATKSNSLQLVITCMNFAKQIINLNPKNNFYKITLQSQLTQLKEVIIKKEEVVKKGDTLIYNVASFAGKNDRSIGDVIAKLPGIEIKQNGTILYQGKPINKYYTQGKDLLNGQYKIANDNIGHENIQNIEILQNHQPIKALNGFEDSDNAAINLDFKKSSLNKPISAGELGTILGSNKATWKATLNTLLIGSKRQSMTTYKGNNVGIDISKELNSLTPSISPEALSFLSAQSTVTGQPTKKDYYYLYNNAHSISTNQLVPVFKNQDLRLNVSYLNDHLSKASQVKTTYYQPDNSVIEVIEPHRNEEQKNHLKLSATLEKNLKYNYFSNQINLIGLWKNIEDIIYQSKTIRQDLKRQNLRFSDNIRWVYTKGKTSYNLETTISYDEVPEYLRVSPSSIFNTLQQPNTILFQEAQSSTFRFDNSSNFTKKTKIGNIAINAEFNIINKNIQTQLYDETQGNKVAIDEKFSNHFNGFQMKAGLKLIYNYKSKNDKFNFSTLIPFQYNFNSAKDPVLNKSQQSNRLLANVILSSKYAISRALSLGSSYNFINGFNDLVTNGFGPIMINYRSLSSSLSDDFVNYKRTNSSYQFNAKYDDFESYLTAFINVGTSESNANQMTAQMVNPESTIITTILHNNKSESKFVVGKIEKTFQKIKTTVSTSITVSENAFEQFQNNAFITIQNHSNRYDFLVKSRASKWVEFNYNIGYVNTKYKDISNNTNRNNATYNQNTSVTISGFKKWSINYELESNYLQYNKKRYNFSDAVIRFRPNKKYDFTLSGRNLANIKTISSATYINNTMVISSYDLRSLNVLLGVKFNL